MERFPSAAHNPDLLKRYFPFAGELMIAHLRYATHGNQSINAVHPSLRLNNWKSRTLVMAGNFNLTNNDKLFQSLVELGQHPVDTGDTVTVMERIGHFLDTAVEELIDELREAGVKDKQQRSQIVAERLDLQDILTKAAAPWDGGYTMAGLVGHGDSFVLRDPNGIRPAYYYHDDEIAVVASERQAIATSFNLEFDDIIELPRGHAFICKKSGEISIVPFIAQGERKSCSFERIYFSRGTDAAIYDERKRLGDYHRPANTGSH